MGFKEVADLDCASATAIGGKNRETGKANPTTISGYFIGTRQVVSKKSKTGFAALHVLQTPKGNVGVWGKTNLDSKMTSVTPGAMIRITFTGMVETKNNPMYKYKVEVDEENSIEVNLAPETQSADSDDTASDSSDESDSTYNDAEEADVDADERAPDEVPPTRAAAPKKPLATPDAARQSQVQALLNRSRNKTAQ